MPAADSGGASNSQAAGLAWGLTAAAIWSAYTVLARLAVTHGMTAQELTLLRFLPGGLLLAPLLWRFGLRDLAGIGWRRGLVLTMLSGPGFSLLLMTGFTLAPLAHGAVIAPGSQMLAGLGLSALIAHQALTRESTIGAALVALGLVFIGGASLLHGGGASTLLGDALFVLAGACWGTFGALSRRWQVEPLRLTCVVGVLALAIYAPGYALVADWQHLARAGSGMITLQIVSQGIGAGVVAMLAFNRAVALLGSGPASFFGAMVPAVAPLLAIPVLGEIPSALEVLGIASVVVGLLIAFGAARFLLTRRGAGG